MNEKKQQLINKIKGQATELLIETAKLLMNNFQEGSDIPFQIIMDVLQEKLPENEFVELCDSL